MAEEKQVLRGIDWQETFSFTHVFRSFRLAIHPSKLVLAFAGLVLCVIAGLVLDKLSYGGRPIIWNNGSPTELHVFAAGGDLGQDFPTWYESQVQMREKELKRLRDRESRLDADEVSIKSASIAGKLIDAKQKKLKQYLDENSLEKEFAKIEKRFPDDADKRGELKKIAKKEIPEKLLAKRRAVHEEEESIRDLVGKGPAGRGPFRALLRYELGVFDKLVASVVSLNLLGGLEMTASELGQLMSELSFCRRQQSIAS